MAIGDVDGSSEERLSALADGELDPGQSAAICSAWGADARLQGHWHAWHLIGDVLRSEDLAAASRSDRRLLEAIRLRLREEPVVLAPEPAAARRVGVARRWAATGAVAAGALLVVGTFVVLQPSGSPAPETIAEADHAAMAPVREASTAPTSASDLTAPPVAIVADNKLIRDAQLDRYLEAHKQFAGSSAVGVPSAFVRRAAVGAASR